MRDYSPADHLDFLLSDVYKNSAFHPEHAADLAKSGIKDETRRAQRMRSVPPHMIDLLLGFEAPKVRHAYVIPFADPRGGWFDHIRLKVFPTYEDKDGRKVKYLGPKNAGPRLFFPIATLPALPSDDAVWLVEGAKKSLAVSQLGLAAIGYEGCSCWHARGSRDLLPDFDFVHLAHRTVELVPDADWRTNGLVQREAESFALALEARGARVRIVALPAAA